MQRPRHGVAQIVLQIFHGTFETQPTEGRASSVSLAFAEAKRSRACQSHAMSSASRVPFAPTVAPTIASSGAKSPKPADVTLKINRARAIELIERGEMQPSGFAEVERAKADGRWGLASESP